MLEKRRKCPSCGQEIRKLHAPKFNGVRYCCSDCAIDAWRLNRERAVARVREILREGRA